ncbi:chaperonin 10-like protein [Lasiosphaeria ovina]|uniref:Chaperonin 10-like protein n=1 Tax=Lasiosphaeria ovina TaxID=92902 RepID=A0AAE0N3F5_9PEZI|nr:chaperonin 10-like protein [Lasiosphaeria ovina]
MSTQNTQYAALGQGQPLTTQTSAKPALEAADEVLMRVRAVAINPADYKMVGQGQRGAVWPLVPGLDGAGVVEAVGADVRRFAVGDRVLAMFSPAANRTASFQTHAVLREQKVARIPDAWSFEEAAGLATCYMTAVVGLGLGLAMPLPFLTDSSPNTFQPSSVLVVGGSSALGAATLQLLRLALPPSTVILATSSPKHHSHLVSALGATAALDRNSPELAAQARAACPGGRGVDAIIDAVGGASDTVFDALDPAGPRRYAQVWTGGPEIVAPAGIDSVLFRGRDLPRVYGAADPMPALQRLLEQGAYKLPLPISVVGHGLDGLQRGLELMRRGVSGEKLVVTL